MPAFYAGILVAMENSQMNCERPICEHLERALVETLFAIGEFDAMRAEANARGQTFTHDALGGMLLLLRSALDSALMLAREFSRAGALQPVCPGQQPVKP
jgi:hypothetical protein